MRKDFGPQTWLYPMPVLIIGTYDESGVPDAMNAAWGGIHNANQIAICVDKGHKTAKNIMRQKEFTVSLADATHIAQCDYVGLVSANDTPDKMEKSGFHIRKSKNVNAPLFDELPFALECKLISYDDNTECVIAEIVNVSVDETVLDPGGNICCEKLMPVCFDPVKHVYREIGKAAGNAFSDGLKLK